MVVKKNAILRPFLVDQTPPKGIWPNATQTDGDVHVARPLSLHDPFTLSVWQNDKRTHPSFDSDDEWTPSLVDG